MKTTIKHQTETGKIETRKTEREYTHVVVRRYTVEEGGRMRADILRSIERLDADRAYANEHAAEAKEHSSMPGHYYVERGYNCLPLDDEWYDRAIAKERKRLAATEALIEQDVVVSWHSTAMLAAKAAEKCIAHGDRGVKVEAINGGER